MGFALLQSARFESSDNSLGAPINPQRTGKGNPI